MTTPDEREQFERDLAAGQIAEAKRMEETGMIGQQDSPYTRGAGVHYVTQTEAVSRKHARKGWEMWRGYIPWCVNGVEQPFGTNILDAPSGRGE